MSVVITDSGHLFDDRKQLMLRCHRCQDQWCTVDCAMCDLGKQGMMSGECFDIVTLHCGCQPVRYFLASEYKPPVLLQKQQQITGEEEVDEQSKAQN
jgi:hypothetical protein